MGESLTVEKAQPAYICYDPESNSEVYATNVRFVDGCSPGLERSAGGGGKFQWRTYLFRLRR